jgi:hypothetical protein
MIVFFDFHMSVDSIDNVLFWKRFKRSEKPVPDRKILP